MQYRRLGNTGMSVSALGFGTMRFPLKEDQSVDEKRAIAMLRRGIDAGINYIDTAYPYHGGQSETIVGKALLDGYREKVYLATKCPVWMIESEADFDRILDEQLEKLQTDCIDCYLLHALDRPRFEQKVKKFQLVDRAVKAREAGKIKWIGFSFHDSYQVFEEILDYTEQWDFCQIQYNYINTEEQPGTKGLLRAAEKGLGVIVMEPLLGGKLANLSVHVAECLPKGKAPVQAAFDYLWERPEVSLLLSGMSDEKQVEDNLLYADRSAVRIQSEDEAACYENAKRIFDAMALVNCTGCGYCMPCPSGLTIPEIFAAYNKSASVGSEEAKEAYEGLSVKPSECVACGSCERECPQHLEIGSRMKEVLAFFEGEK